ncbi:hypothetical protein GIB67_040328, partial [Kingdonia uniflora]
QNCFCSNTFQPEEFYSNRFYSIRIDFWYFRLKCFIRIDFYSIRIHLFYSNRN